MSADQTRRGVANQEATKGDEFPDGSGRGANPYPTRTVRVGQVPWRPVLVLGGGARTGLEPGSNGIVPGSGDGYPDEVVLTSLSYGKLINHGIQSGGRQV